MALISSRKSPADRLQEEIASPVYSEADIRRTITRRKHDGRPCNLLLGDDIVVKAGFLLPEDLEGFSIEGGSKYRLLLEGDIDTLFTCLCSPCRFEDLTIELKTGATLETGWLCLGEPVILRDVRVDASAGTATSVFSGSSPDHGTGAVQLVVDTARFTDFEHLFAPDGSAVTWVACRFSDIDLTHTNIATPISIGHGAGDVNFGICVFERLRGVMTIDLGSASGSCTFASLDGLSGSTFATNGTTGHFATGLGGFNSPSLGEGDVFVAAGRGAIFNTAVVLDVKAVTLNSADPTLTVGESSFIQITLGASASGNVTLSNGLRTGHVLVLQMISTSAAVTFPDSTAQNMRLTAAWTPGGRDTLTLIWDGSDWVETARADV